MAKKSVWIIGGDGWAYDIGFGGAVAKFASSGKAVRKKDLGMIAMAYEKVCVASVAFGGKDAHTLKVFQEAESYDGPSLIIAYSPCTAHGIDLTKNLQQQQLAMKSGYWSLYCYDPRRAEQGKNPLQLDSPKPSILNYYLQGLMSLTFALYS
ncbi:MAG TPA: hypothetical protein EYG71_07110 [Leucothrix sp.]|nr:hypothetical protein [Leucothrix sp.]